MADCRVVNASPVIVLAKEADTRGHRAAATDMCKLSPESREMSKLPCNLPFPKRGLQAHQAAPICPCPRRFGYDGPGFHQLCRLVFGPGGPR